MGNDKDRQEGHNPSKEKTLEKKQFESEISR